MSAIFSLQKNLRECYQSGIVTKVCIGNGRVIDLRMFASKGEGRHFLSPPLSESHSRHTKWRKELESCSAISEGQNKNDHPSFVCNFALQHTAWECNLPFSRNKTAPDQYDNKQ